MPTTDTVPTCVVVRPGETYDGKQGFTFVAGNSTESAGSTGIGMHLLTIPSGGRAKTHLHERHETAISGVSESRYGEGLREHATI